ncbi:MAG: hypothetical protein Fur0020_04000 [Thermodesulfovibrionia bacterium]
MSIVKVSTLSGLILGAVLGITVSLLLDFMTGSAVGGGWYEAVRHDISRLIGSQWAERQWFVYSGIVIVIGMISVMGAMMGALFGFIVGKILSIMTR